LRVETGEDAHEGIEVFLLAEGDGDCEHLLEHAGAGFGLGLDEDEGGDPGGEVLLGRMRSIEGKEGESRGEYAR
jgi:hypothetical protein